MDKILQVCTDFCSGCGLCHSVAGVSFTLDEKGYYVPELKQDQEWFCSKVCPASGYALKNYQDGSIWGAHILSTLGWSADPIIRKGSSSGGVLTTLCVYLLENGLVDGIIQTRQSLTDIRKTETVLSKTKEEVLSCMGSRYTTSSPLANLDSLIRGGGKYAFVGKPCDVSSLRIYIDEIKPELKKTIIYLFSFFCAGQPSLLANNKLVKALGGVKLSECVDLQYRGNGWPGFATLTMKDGSKKQMDYETSWMKILGRDVRNICRVCADGTGELADISCGDAWYLGDNNKPDFSEHPGRNVIFVRTEAGNALLNKAVEDGCIEVVAFEPDRDGLRKIQPYHYTRKASLLVYRNAFRICGRVYPLYDTNKMQQFGKSFPFKQKVLRFGGTIQRIIKGKI